MSLRSVPVALFAVLACGCSGGKDTTGSETGSGDDDDTTQIAPTCGPCCHTPSLPECDSATPTDTGDTGA